MTMRRSALIIDCTCKSYHAGNHDRLALGGIERTIIQLSQALARKGMDVSVWNNTDEAINAGGVNWIPKKRTDLLKSYDIVIACNDSCLFDTYAQASGHKDFLPVVWFHNRVTFEKIIRKGRMPSLLRWRPVGVFLGTDHLKNATRFLPLRQKVIIGHGLEQAIFDNIPDADPVADRTPVAIFISQAYRGLNGIIRLWVDKIHPAIPNAELRVYSADFTPENLHHLSKSDLAAYGIRLEGRLPRLQLIEAMREARVCVIPGHADETFCLAAAESLALRVPVITYGTGALRERVANGKNGFVAADESDFAQKLHSLLSDKALWQKLYAHGLENAEQYTWDAAANHWISLFQDGHA